MRHTTAAGTRIASYNIHKCVGTDRRFDPGRIAEVIAEIDADVLALQEADERFGNRAGLLDLVAIARRTGLEPVGMTADDASHGWRGNLLLMRNGRVQNIRRLSLPGVEPRGALIADLDLAHGSLRVIATHLGLLRTARRRQVARLETAAHEGANGHPVVLLGDLNEWRRHALHGRAPGFEPDGPREPSVLSFPAGFPMLPLDRIFARPCGIMSCFAVHDTPLARRASDHLPVTAQLDLAARPAHLSEDARAAAPRAHLEPVAERIQP